MCIYLCILGNISLMRIVWFSLQTNLSCLKTIWLMYQWTIYCCILNQTISSIQPYDSRKKKIQNLEKWKNIFKYQTISSSSASTISYSLKATQKMIAVTPSKQWIHFFLSDRCPPTSNILEKNENFFTSYF